MPRPSIEIGATYGDMVCIEKVASKRNHARFKVKYKVCGKEKEVYGTNLKSGEGISHKTSCKPDIVEIGSTYDDLTVLNREENRGYAQAYKVKCNVCGREKVVLAQQLLNRNGTLHKWCVYSLGKYDKAFRERYVNMRNRTNPNIVSEKNACYRRYNVSSEGFSNFVDFYDAMYESYVEHVEKYGVHDTTLDRIDSTKGYSPTNCRWATRKEQAANKILK